MKSSLQWGLSLGAIALIFTGVLVRGFYRPLTQIPSSLNSEISYAEPDQHQSELFKGAVSTVERMRNGVLTEADLNAFFVYSLAQDMENSNEPQVLLGTQVELTTDSLKSTSLVDLSQVDESSLDTGRLSLVRRLLKVPGIGHRKISIAVEGKPIVRDRYLAVENPIISIGEMQLTKSEAVQWLGVSGEILQERLDKDWSGLPIDLEAVTIIAGDDGNVLKLTGSPTAW